MPNAPYDDDMTGGPIAASGQDTADSQDITTGADAANLSPGNNDAGVSDAGDDAGLVTADSSLSTILLGNADLGGSADIGGRKIGGADYTDTTVSLALVQSLYGTGSWTLAKSDGHEYAYSTNARPATLASSAAVGSATGLATSGIEGVVGGGTTAVTPFGSSSGSNAAKAAAADGAGAAVSAASTVSPTPIEYFNASYAVYAQNTSAAPSGMTLLFSSGSSELKDGFFRASF